MIPLALPSARTMAWAAAALAIAGACVWSYRLGADRVQGRWDAAEAQRLSAEADQRREDSRISRQASEHHQREAAQVQARMSTLRKELRDALNQPIPTCPATLGAVVVPAGAVDRLRAAGADPAP